MHSKCTVSKYDNSLGKTGASCHRDKLKQRALHKKLLMQINQQGYSIFTNSGSRYMARLRAIGAYLGTGHYNNIRWMTVVTSD